MIATQTTPFFKKMPQQTLGGHWHLAGLLEGSKTDGAGGITLVRKIDALSLQISAAKTCHYVIPKLTVITPSGRRFNFQNAKVTGQTDTNELERISFTFQKIDVTWNDGGKSAKDDWNVPV